MHAHDRTLIANLGFADADKRNATHEQACHFFCEIGVALALAGLHRPRSNSVETTQYTEFKHPCWMESYSRGSLTREPYDRELRIYRTNTFNFACSKLTQALTEVPVNKGSGQYQTTVGFMDVALAFEEVFALSKSGVRPLDCPYCADRFMTWPGTNKPPGSVKGVEWSMAIEVKIGRVAVSDIIRQLNLYKTYVNFDEWVLATPWMLNSHEMESLKAHKIRHVLLGDQFEKFSANAGSAPAARSDVVF